MRQADKVLVLCAANICRSPTAAIMIQQLTHIDSVEVSSAGLDAEPGEPICVKAQQFLRRRGSPDSAQKHLSTSVTREAVSAADLILTATRDQRSAVARLDPTAKERTFTLAEVGYLSSVVQGQLKQSPTAVTLADIVAHLHSVRWRAGADAPFHTVRSRWAREDPLSLPDVHLRETGHHRVVFSRIRKSATAIASLLSLTVRKTG